MMKHAILGLGALAMVGATAGCESGQGPTRNQTYGALGGAALGALAGTLVGGNDRRNALVGAGIGLLAGAAVGTYLDRTYGQLSQNLEGTGAEVTRLNDAILVSLPSGVMFDTDSAAVRDPFRAPLSRVAQTLVNNPESYIDVVGHTDSQGSDSYNQGLSEQRAATVSNILQRNGVQPVRLRSYGVGETQPVATNDTAAGRAQNRRVELRVIPATGA